MPPAILTSGIFTFTSAGLATDSIPRCSESRLRALLIPPKPLSPADKKLLTKRWATAQLHHYQLPVPKGTKDVVFQALQYALATNQCSTISASVVEIETRLRSQHDAIVAAEEKKRDVENKQKEVLVEAAFEKITDPVEAANCSIPLFLRRHFLGADGKVDRGKAPEAMALPGFDDRCGMHAAARNVGLYTQSGGTDSSRTGRERVIVVGTHRALVFWEAAKINVEHQRLNKAEREEGKKMLLAAVVKNIKGSGSAAAGRYTVFCDEIEEQWPDDAKNGFSLEIYSDRERKRKRGKGDVLAASFDWGVLEGIMRFRADDEEWEDFDGDDSYNGSEEEGDSDSSPWKKRKQAAPKGLAKNSRLSATKKTDPFKLHFKWIGRETGEMEAQNFPGQKGTIQFLDKEFLKFEGLVDIGFVGEKIEFTGFKVGAERSQRARANRWSDYAYMVVM